MERFAAYKIDDINALDTPAMVVYPSIIKRNIQQLIKLFDNVQQLRPHVKTHKCPQVVDLLLKAGITKFKCATIAEAEMLASAGAADVLLAYQPVGPKVERFIKLMNSFPTCLFSCLVDSQATAHKISEAAMHNNMQVNCFIDLNVGMNRTGVSPAQAKVLFLELCDLPGIKMTGLHAYDGHLTDQDANLRLSRAAEGFVAVRSLADELVSVGFPQLRIVAGSTPTIAFYVRQPDVECSPGTFIYWDQHYQNSYPDLPFESGALIVTRVVSKPTSTTACFDLGYKAISSEGEINQRVYFPELMELEVVSQSEEHLLIASVSDQLSIGDVVYGMPYHIGRTCNLYEESAVVEEQKIIEHWQHTARVRQLSI
jgi:D-serine deaminase-like pyridoxal phosphate-dependent protein